MYFFTYISVLLTALHFQNNAVDIKIGNVSAEVNTKSRPLKTIKGKSEGVINLEAVPK
jgi:hypothetical protein